MTNSEFLEEGEWIGLSTKASDFTDRNISVRPIGRLRFQTSRHLQRPDILRLYTCKIKKPDLVIEGLIHQPTGVAVLILNHTNIIGRQWHCLMTPFGFVGTWKESSGCGGWIWLWKRREDSESYQHQRKIAKHLKGDGTLQS